MWEEASLQVIEGSFISPKYSSSIFKHFCYIRTVKKNLYLAGYGGSKPIIFKKLGKNTHFGQRPNPEPWWAHRELLCSILLF